MENSDTFCLLATFHDLFYDRESAEARGDIPTLRLNTLLK